MGRRGPKPKPTALKRLAGNPGKRALPANEPRPNRSARAPRCPAWLNDDAQALWRIYARPLWELGLLTELDVDALATLCEATALYRKACKAITVEGAVHMTDSGYRHASPWVNIRNQALGQMKQLWAVFGMTPGDRSRIEMPAGEDDDPFEAFLHEMQKEGG